MAESSLILPGSDASDTEARTWGVDRFRYDKRAEHLRDSINNMDIAGRARCLVWGPYDVLGPGRWTATVSFSVDKWACRHSYALEFGHIDNYARFEFRPGKPGQYELDISFDAVKEAKTEIRFIIDESALGGMLLFSGAQVRKVK